MAIVINSSPDIYSSLHAPLWYVVGSNNNLQTNFKYVCDVYVGGNLVTRLKSYPQPVSTKGIFNVSPIIRNYWASYFKPNITIPSTFSYTGSDVYVDFEIKFGEEYDGTTYTNLVTSTKRAYNYVQDYLYTPTSPMYLTPLEYETQYQGNFISNRDFSNIYFNKERLQTGYLFLYKNRSKSLAASRGLPVAFNCLVSFFAISPSLSRRGEPTPGVKDLGASATRF